MGTLMRRYWQPVLLSWELPEPDLSARAGAHPREGLVAFRDTAGRVGLMRRILSSPAGVAVGRYHNSVSLNVSS